MNKKKLLSFAIALLLGASSTFAQKQPVDYVNPLMGTDSKISLSNGNTYPAIALPWGMNFWMPQTGKMGDGWAYTYASDKIRGFKQTHQPSPWINDYGQFSIMPMTKQLKIDQDSRASWFSHKAEKATPYYYSVYLSEYDMTTEIAPTERCAYFRFTFPETSDAYVVVDAFDRGSYVKVIPEENKIVGYTTRNSGGVPQNFKNYFVIEFDKPFTFNKVWADYHLVETHLELQSNHVGAAIGFSTKKGEQVHAKVASSFISPEQAELNLKEIGNKTFEQTKEAGRKAWNNVLGRIKVEDSDENRMRTFYSCLYRSVLFPRMFYEVNGKGETVHYSPYNGEIRPGYMFTDTGFWDTFRCLFPFVNLIYPSMGEKLGRPAEELDVYKKRSQNYRNLFDPETKLMRGKNSDGTFQTPFNPFKWGDAFTEGNSWHYTWSVFHDVQGLVDLMGGKKMFVSMLDSVFNLPPVFDDSYYGGVIHEIREMEIANMGNYAHGNQPIQHMIYLYNYAGEPWKAQYWLRETMNRLYLPTPDGYCGDEDNGQTSAWYVFTALGFYPVCPGSNEYVMGAPYFKKATITLENGKKLEISAPKNNDDNRYIRSLNYNGKNYTKNYLNHFDLLKGGRLVFDMDNKPNRGRGINESDFPYSFSRDAK